MEKELAELVELKKKSCQDCEFIIGEECDWDGREIFHDSEICDYFTKKD